MLRSMSSSSWVHEPLISSGFSTFCHRCRHCTSVRFSKKEAIRFQFFGFTVTQIALPRTASPAPAASRPRSCEANSYLRFCPVAFYDIFKLFALCFLAKAHHSLLFRALHQFLGVFSLEILLIGWLAPFAKRYLLAIGGEGTFGLA